MPLFVNSGGVDREWAGVPRLYFYPGSNRSRCVCVKSSGAPNAPGFKDTRRGDLDNPNIKEYRNCPHDSEECYVPKEP